MAKKTQKRKNELVFDPKKRESFLTGFSKRKKQRQRKAQEEIEIKLKEERKRIKLEVSEIFCENV
jgi:ribosomal RNA-processing protein 17